MSLRPKGDTTPRVVEGSEFSLSVDGNSAKVVMRGNYAQLKSFAPPVGFNFSYEGFTFNVIGTSFRRDHANLGTLTISLGDTRKTGTGLPNNDSEPNSTIEVDYTIMEKPIEQHPLFKPIYSTGWMGAVKIELWKSLGADAAKRKAEFQYPLLKDSDPKNDAHWAFLVDPERPLAKKLLSGIESYFLQVPIIRKTTVVPTAPKDSQAGMRSDPPEDFGMTSKQWIKTADRATSSGRNGTWERVEEWTGFDSLDPDLYP